MVPDQFVTGHESEHIASNRRVKYLLTDHVLLLMAKKATTPGTIRSDETLLIILRELQHLEPAGVTELSNQLDVSKGTVHKHLKTLEAAQFVNRSDGKYSLGLRFLSLGGKARNNNRLCFLAKERVANIATETSEMTKFAVEINGRGIWIYFFNDHYDMRRDMHVGGTFHLHQNAPGKAILSSCSDNRIDEIVDEFGLPAQTDETITDRAELFAELDQIRESRIAKSSGEFREGGISIAASVTDPERDTRGAISIAAPTTNTTCSTLIDDYGELLLQTTQRLELQMRYV